MGQKFNINKVIERYKLNTDEVAEVLFPHARYKKLALARVLKGEASLSAEQLEALAKLAGIFIHDLFFVVDDWKGATSEDGSLVFLKDDYRVKLNYNGVFLSIYKGADLIHQELTLKNMSVPEFIEYVNKVINNQKLNANGTN